MDTLGHYLSQTTQHQLLAASAGYSAAHMASQSLLPRIPSVPETGYDSHQSYPQSASYYQLPRQSESLKAPSTLGQHYYVDRMMNPHPYSSLYHGLDINAIRRKNATRETTGPLKTWLKAHRKNPYPTKGEKVMLAISTRMTLTQVSTWFANARRRMKKDKIEDNNDEQESLPDVDLLEKRERSGSMSSCLSHYSTSEADSSNNISDISDIDIDDSGPKRRPTKKCVQRLFSPDPRTDHLIDPSSSPDSILSERLSSPDNCESHNLPTVSEIMPNFIGNSSKLEVPIALSRKPKIWSISEIIGSASSTLNTENSSTIPYNYNSIPYSDYFSTGQMYNYPTIDTTSFSGYSYNNNPHSHGVSSSQVQYL